MKNFTILVRCTTNESRGCFTYNASSLEEALLKAVEDFKNTKYEVVEARESFDADGIMGRSLILKGE